MALHFKARRSVDFFKQTFLNRAMKKWIIGGVAVLVLVVIALIIKEQGGSLVPLSGAELDWRQLSEMDYITGKAPPQLEALNGKNVKLPGFMVPLEDNQKDVTEFLLVPNAQACIHVPPPPANQMVYVKMKKGIPAVFEPIWIYGKFKILTKKSMYGDASFEIEGDGFEVYR